MNKHNQRWSIWKIAAATAGGAVVTILLFWGALLTGRVGPAAATSAPRPTGAMTLPGLLIMLAMLAALLTVLGIVWLVARIREARMPAWKRRGKKKRR